MKIERPLYLNKLIGKMENGFIKVVTGIRRCGKSYLLGTLFKDYLLAQGVPEDNIITVALDDRANKNLRNPDECYAYVKSRVGQGQHYLFIDEVQMMDEFEDVLNGFLHIDNLDTYVTGSNSEFLSTDVVSRFRDRGDVVHLHPLSFAEFYAHQGGDWDDAWQDYITFGGLPHICALHDDRDKIAYLDSLFTETYLRDVVERYNIRNEPELAELVRICASAVGSLTNPEKLERTFSTLKRVSLSSKTISKYLGYLENAFMVSKALQYNVKGKRYISTPAKYYFEDLGLRNAVLGFRQQEETHLMENAIYNELRLRGYAVDVGVVELTEGGVKKKVEIDFIANEGSRRYYIQSAYALPDTDKQRQEIRPLLAIRDSFKKIVIVGGSRRPSQDDTGIVTMGLKQFMLDPDSLDALN